MIGPMDVEVKQRKAYVRGRRVKPTSNDTPEELPPGTLLTATLSSDSISTTGRYLTERALHDALSIVKRILESNTVVAGGGTVETTVTVYLEHFATSLGSREQLAIAEFSKALLIISKVLAVNSAKDLTDLVSKLWACHNTQQTKTTPTKDKKEDNSSLQLKHLLQFSELMT